MRTFPIFQMAYATAGMNSSLLLHRPDGILISLWMLVLGAVPFLGLTDFLKPAIRRMLRRD